jgi:hypothetical protein
MNVDQAIAVFSAYSPDEKKEFLAQLMYELTVFARDGYEVGGEGLTDPQRVRRINEIQHCLSAFLGQLLRGDSRRYPDDSIVRIVLEHPGDDGLARQAMASFERAHRLTAGVSVS